MRSPSIALPSVMRVVGCQRHVTRDNEEQPRRVGRSRTFSVSFVVATSGSTATRGAVRAAAPTAGRKHPATHRSRSTKSPRWAPKADELSPVERSAWERARIGLPVVILMLCSAGSLPRVRTAAGTP